MPEPNPVGPPWTPELAGIVDCREMYRGKSRQASLDSNPSYTRIFLVRTDTVNPNLANVAAAPGIDWRAQYPDDENAFLVESNTQQEGDSPFHYKVTFQYKYIDDSEKIPWLRTPQFSFSGSLASAPCFWYYKNPAPDNDTKEIIVNSAKDPLGGLDRDEGEFTVTIQANIKPPFDYAGAQLYVGAINSDQWSGGDPGTWKCQSISANRKVETISGQTPEDPPVKVVYYEASTTLAYRSTGWDLMTWNIGFNEIKSGKRIKILGGDGQPVSEPVALNPDGTAKTPGLPPDMLTFRIYRKLPFTGRFFKIPSDQLSGYPYTVAQPIPT